MRISKINLPLLCIALLSAACAPRVTETETTSPSGDMLQDMPVFEAGQVDHSAFVAAPIGPADFEPLDEDRPIRVVATVGQIADLAARIGGERIELTQIVPGADDPHLYVPSPGDVRAFSAADLILYNGLFLEGQMGETFAQMDGLGIATVAVTAGMRREMLLEREYDAGSYVTDPHVWFDPRLWAEASGNILTALSALAPTHAEEFERSHAELLVELEQLETWCREQLAGLPESRRVLVTSHDAFGYFGRRFGLEVVGLQGLSTEAEAGLQDVEALVDLIVERDIPAVFVEASVSPEAIRAVAEAVVARGGSVRVGGELFSDTPGIAGSAAGTYPGMLLWNVATVTTALGGSVDGRLPPELAGYGGYDLEALVEAASEEARGAAEEGGGR